jgi:hypothetical protein
MMNFTSDQWVIVALVFVLGLLIGGFLFSGSGRKWKQRYNAEVAARKDLTTTYAEREKDWCEQDALRAAALKDAERNRPVTAAATTTADPRDVNNDGVVTEAEHKPGLMDRVLGRDRDGDGVTDTRDGYVDRDGDGVDDRR